MPDFPTVAIVHERFTEMGGSEAVVRELARMWPDSHVVAPIADAAIVRAAELEGRVSTGPLQRLYGGGRGYAHLAPLIPPAMAATDVAGADLIVTSHHAFANRVRPPAGIPIVSYTHSPARWMWDPAMRRHEAAGRLGLAALEAFAASQRKPDRRAAAQLTGIMANSHAVADRIDRWWGRSSVVVPPPVDTEFFTPDSSAQRQDFFLLAGRLVAYKRPDLAIAAAEAAGTRLVVAGDGRHRSRCIEIAGGNIEMVGSVGREELRRLYRCCRALVFAGVEDFGIVPVEAQACGAPVIALGAGGALDTVLDGVTGRLVDPGTDDNVVAALSRAMSEFDDSSYDPVKIRENAERFSVAEFHRRVGAAISDLVGPGLVPAQMNSS